MIQLFKGNYGFNNAIVSGWDSTAIGVYYCGALNSNGNLVVYYIGRAIGDDGIRGRLLQHLSETKWPDVTHFGYHVCDTQQEALSHEALEIGVYKPKYNKIGK